MKISQVQVSKKEYFLIFIDNFFNILEKKLSFDKNLKSDRNFISSILFI